MDDFTHDKIKELAEARNRKEKAQEDEDRILTEIIIHIEEVKNDRE